MIHFPSTLSGPNFSMYQFLVPYAVAPRFAATNISTDNIVLLHHCPAGAPRTASEK